MKRKTSAKVHSSVLGPVKVNTPVKGKDEDTLNDSAPPQLKRSSSFSDNDNDESEEEEKKAAPAPVVKKPVTWESIAIRTATALGMMAVYIATLHAGHLYCILLSILTQIELYRELVNVRYVEAKETTDNSDCLET